MPSITIKSNSMEDVEKDSLSVLSDVEGPSVGTVLSETTGPSATNWSDIVYNVLGRDYVTNINAFEFGFVPFNDVLTYD